MVEMNYWTKLSIEYANQRSYLDDLFRIYPTIPSGIREIDQNKWEAVKTSFNNQNNIDLIKNLLKLKLFPIKDSYVAYLRKDQYIHYLYINQELCCFCLLDYLLFL